MSSIKLTTIVEKPVNATGPKVIIQLPSTSKSSIIIIIAMTMWHVMCSLGPVPLVLLVAILKD